MRTRIIGILSTEHTEDTDRRKLSTELFFLVARAQEIFGGNLLLDVADARNEIPIKYNL